MTAAASYGGGPAGDPSGSRVLLWIAGLSIAVAAHAGAAALVMRAPHAAPPAPAPAPVVMLELAPEPAAPPAPQTYVADSLSQPEEMVEMETPPHLDVPPPLETPPRVDAPVADTLPEIAPLPELPPSEVAVPRPLRRPEVQRVEKVPEKKEEKREVKREEKVAEQKRPQSQASSVAAAKAADTARAPETVSARGATVSPARWQAQLMAHLERRKRYPAASRSRREEGTAQVHFSIDARGNVLSTKLVRSSGHPALDEAAVALVQRASPVPAPPAAAPRSITAPIRFDIR